MFKLLTATLFTMMILGCKRISVKDDFIEPKIINDCFIDVVDTFAYRYHSFRPAPNDSSIVGTDSITIGIFNKLTVPAYWKKAVEVTLAELPDTLSNKKGYLNLFTSSNNDTTEKEFDVSLITKKGKYRLITETKINAHKVPGIIGSIEFSRVYYDQNKKIGIFTVKIKDNIRSGIEKLILLKKHDSLWKKESEVVIDTW